jgi:hypothetical protein
MKRISAYIDQETYDAVEAEAKKDNRSFNFMLGALLQQSLKERERLRLKNQKRKKPETQE